MLTEIDIAATFKAELGIVGPPLKILGACNPHLARQALDTDPDAALVLPCNVVLEATDHGTTVSAADPHDIITNPALATLADDAPTRSAPHWPPSTEARRHDRRPRDGAGERIVVGVDGSPDARRALRLAIDNAGPDNTIELVNAWEQPAMAAQA